MARLDPIDTYTQTKFYLLCFTVTSSNLILAWSLNNIANPMILIKSHQMSGKIVNLIRAQTESNKWQAYFGLASRSIYQINFEPWAVCELISTDFSIRKLLFYSSKRRLIALTDNLLVYQYLLSPSSSSASASLTSYQVSEFSKTKLSFPLNSSLIDMLELQLIDNELGLIAIYSKGCREIRLWQLETGAIESVIATESEATQITSLDYWNGLLAVGTGNNLVSIYKLTHDLKFHKPHCIVVKGSVVYLFVSKTGQIICLTSTNLIYLIDQESMSSDFNGSLAAVQVFRSFLNIFLSHTINVLLLHFRLDQKMFGFFGSIMKKNLTFNCLYESNK